MSPAALEHLGNSTAAVDVPPPRYRWSTRVLLPGLLVLSLGGIFTASIWSAVVPAVPVEIVPAVERPAKLATAAAPAPGATSSVVQAAGWIEPDPFPVGASALAGGTVLEVLVLEGDPVARGEVLARLDPDDANLALRRAEAELKAARDAWETNISATRTLEVSTAATRETAAALALARAELEAEQAMLAEAERIRARRDSLYASGSISEEEQIAAEASHLVRMARTEAASHRIASLEAELDRRRAEEDAARRDAEWRIEERLRLEHTIVVEEEARLRVERLEIRSPIDGVVMRRLVQPGSRVMPDSDMPGAGRIAELYDPRKLQVRVDVPLADAARIGAGQEAEIVVEVLPDRTFRGTVTRLTNLADIAKNTLEVKVAVHDPAPEIKPEMLARVRFLSRAEPQEGGANSDGRLSVYIPENAISNSGVWVLTEFDGERGIARRRSIQSTGARDGEWLELAGGVLPGDLIIQNAHGELAGGRRVRVVEGAQ